MPVRNRASITCFSCRKRKIKCGRETPQCSQCRLGLHLCKYPDGVQKPGPKAGSARRARRPNGLDQDSNYRISGLLGPRSQDNTLRSISRCDGYTTPSGEITRGQCDDNTTPSLQPASGNTKDPQSDDIQRISYLIHPSHETIDLGRSNPIVKHHDKTQDEERPLLFACRALEVTEEVLDYM
jgi:hypothetical protein